LPRNLQDFGQHVVIFDQINEISFQLNDRNHFDVFALRSFAMLLKQEQKKRLIAQLVRHRTSIAEVRVAVSFRSYFRYCLSSIAKTAKIINIKNGVILFANF